MQQFKASQTDPLICDLTHIHAQSALTLGLQGNAGCGRPPTF